VRIVVDGDVLVYALHIPNPHYILSLTRTRPQVANQFFTETSLPTFPYRLRGIMRK
jgi:hypothetical protein